MKKRHRLLLTAIAILVILIVIPFCVVFFVNGRTYGFGWVERKTWILQQGETLALWTKVSPLTLDSFDPPMTIKFDLRDGSGSVISTATRRVEEDSDLRPLGEIERKELPGGVAVSGYDTRHPEAKIFLKRTTP